MDTNSKKSNAAKQDKAEKLSKFAQVLSRLRKERGISQKKAASDLGISQALLSHYEKGIRECGLDFVIRCSEYYGVTADYLLGISENRTGMDLSFVTEDNMEMSSVQTLAAAANMLLKIIATAKDVRTSKYIFDYYTLCVYRGALTMAKAGILPKEMFKLDFNLGRELASAAIAVEDARFVFIEDKSRTGTDLSEKTALHEIIENAEEHILTRFYLE
ncbi:MAG TPA: helix-turn-helix domain-containing protein [Candidatus Eubacterium faecigallinarum]|nr:helix-turn-helix domain-containing protein [Candidatus Eubacterium faecigallinarum]